MDTRDKRSSAILHSLPWRGLFPLPDGAVNQADRQHTCNMYRGIAAGAPAPIVVIQGLLTVIFTSRIPHATFTSRAPYITFTSRAPHAIFETED